MAIIQSLNARIDELMDMACRTEEQDIQLRKLCLQRAKVLTMPGRS